MKITAILLALFAIALLMTAPASAQKTYYCPQTDVMLQPLVKTSLSGADLRCDYGLERYDLRFLCHTYHGKFADDARVTKAGKLRCIYKGVKQ